MSAKKIHRMFLHDEGLRLKAYRCTAGKLTIGVGRNLDAVGISRATALQMLEEDVVRADETCRLVFGPERWETWSENRCLGWVNFAFNLGHTGMLQFKRTLAAAFRDDWKGVEAGLKASLWARQVGDRAQRVIAMICREEFPYAE